MRKVCITSTQNLSDALAKVPGLKLREAGGVGSDMILSLDGFSGKHVKLFIDGVPQGRRKFFPDEQHSH